MRAIHAMVLIAASVLAGCGMGPTEPTAPTAPAVNYSTTTFSFTSDPDDYVGRGRTQTFTMENSRFSANVQGNGGYLSIVIRPLNGETPAWGMVVMPPTGTRIVPGTYQSARDFGERFSVDFGGDGRGCSVITGYIVIHEFDFITENQALKHFRASFEQHCQGAAAALRGEVAILADPWR
jgi:hypothetical protein